MEESQNSLFPGELISQGAEAKVYQLEFLGQPAVLKLRFPKKYRLPILDEKITSRRILQEVRSIYKCLKNNLPTPAVYHVDPKQGIIILERIHGVTLKQFLLEAEPTAFSDQYRENIMKEIGHILAKLHSLNIIHGDLTTSNMLLQRDPSLDKEKEIPNLFLIDFGLSTTALQPEDKAVDLYVLERAFQATHPTLHHLFEAILTSYSNYPGSNQKSVIKKLDEVRLRGRKKSMVG